VRAAGLTPVSSKDDAGFGLLSTVISLLIVALLSLGALKAFGGTSSTATGSQALGADVSRAYDVQAQTTLSNTVQSVRADLLSNGAVSGLDLTQFGVTTGPSTSPADVSGAVASGGVDGSLGSGSTTLAVDSKSGTCWFVWLSASTTWFGVQPDATSCVAQPMVDAPVPGPSSPGTIGWQQGSFPLTG
jgi:hypothetical protein